MADPYKLGESGAALWIDKTVKHTQEEPSDLLANPFNFRIHTQMQQAATVDSLDALGWIDDIKVNINTGHIVDGHERVMLAMRKPGQTVPVKWIDLTEEEERIALMSLDYITSLAGIDGQILTDLAALVNLDGLANLGDSLASFVSGHDNQLKQALFNNQTAVVRRTLAERFLVPPFSVLDTRQGYWLKRKKAWLELGLRGELGRSMEGDEATGAVFGNAQAGLNRLMGTDGIPSTSVFDPVLCEVIYRWFAPPYGSVIDPFAGEATKGIIAGALGLTYTGMELRERQVDENNNQAAAILGRLEQSPLLVGDLHPAQTAVYQPENPILELRDTAVNVFATEAADLHNSASAIPLRSHYSTMEKTAVPYYLRLYEVFGEKLDIAETIDTQPVAKAIDDGTMWILFSGGKDSIAAALIARELGYKPVLFYVAGINRAYANERTYAQNAADAMGMPLVIDTVKVTGNSSHFMESPVKNHVMASLMVARMAEAGGSHWATGMQATDNIDDIDPFTNFSDIAIGNELWNDHLSAKLEGLEHHWLIQNTHQSVAKVAEYGMLDYAHGCMTALRFQGRLHDLNVKKFGADVVLHGRCGSCYKCGSEYAVLEQLGVLRNSPEYYAHIDRIMKEKGSQHPWMIEGVSAYHYPDIMEHYPDVDFTQPKPQKNGTPVPYPTPVRQLPQTAVVSSQNQALSAVPIVYPTWLQGDSAAIDAALPHGTQYDLMFTSPPYYDLEIYSDKEADGSAFSTYEQFLIWYTNIIVQCANRLRDNRFMVIKVGEIRDENGAYRNFVGDTVQAAVSAGLAYYNEAILVTAAGSLPIRTSAQFPKNRKLGKTHQNVLIFYKGDTTKVGEHFTQFVEYGELTDEG